MSTFRDYLNSNLDIFFNTDEFATAHTINDIEMLILLDNDLLKERQAKLNEPEGVYMADVLFHVKKSVYGERPVPGMVINFDGDITRVAHVEEDEGMYTIALMGNDS
jgi:hypothetical protein